MVDDHLKQNDLLQKKAANPTNAETCGTTITAEAALKVCKGRRDRHKKKRSVLVQWETPATTLWVKGVKMSLTD